MNCRLRGPGSGRSSLYREIAPQAITRPNGRSALSADSSCVAADVVEAHVDAVRERLLRRLLAVVERLDPERAQPLDLLRRACAADHPQPLELRDLGGGAADRARSAGDVDRLAFLDPPDVDEARPRPSGRACRARRARSTAGRATHRASAGRRPRRRLARTSRGSTAPSRPRRSRRGVTRRRGRRHRRRSRSPTSYGPT